MGTSRPPLSSEVRARLRTLILERKPWLRSTGPHTAPGKARASGNSWRHGFYAAGSTRARQSLKGVRPSLPVLCGWAEERRVHSNVIANPLLVLCWNPSTMLSRCHH